MSPSTCAEDFSSECGMVIKDDLKFAGQRVKIVSAGKLQIDCEFEGDLEPR